MYRVARAVVVKYLLTPQALVTRCVCWRWRCPGRLSPYVRCGACHQTRQAIVTCGSATLQSMRINRYLNMTTAIDDAKSLIRQERANQITSKFKQSCVQLAGGACTYVRTHTVLCAFVCMEFSLNGDIKALNEFPSQSE